MKKSLKTIRNEYSTKKSKQLAIWRPRIFSRDNYRCQVPECGSKRKLECAHITPTTIFVKKYGANGIEKSFRWDNLITLCSECHKWYHRSSKFNLTRWRLYKARNVYKLFHYLKQKRGYVWIPELGMKNKITIY